MGCRDGKASPLPFRWGQLGSLLAEGRGGRVKLNIMGFSSHPGRCGASLTAERALWPPGRALVPPPSQPGPAQSPQEVPRGKVGEVEARETGWQRKVCCVLLGGVAAAVRGEITPG